MSAILNWIKEFLILYLILTILMQLTAAEEYKKYLRFLSGIILLLVLVSPVLHLFGEDGSLKIMRPYTEFWQNMDGFSLDAQQAEFLQNEQSFQKYEKAAAAEIAARAQEQGIAVSQVRVSLSDDYAVNYVSVWLDARQKGKDPSGKDRMVSLLKDIYHLEDRQIFID